MNTEILITLFFCPQALGFPSSEEIGFQECNLAKLNFVDLINSEAIRLRSECGSNIHIGGEKCFYLSHKSEARYEVRLPDGMSEESFMQHSEFDHLRALLQQFNDFDFHKLAELASGKHQGGESSRPKDDHAGKRISQHLESLKVS